MQELIQEKKESITFQTIEYTFSMNNYHYADRAIVINDGRLLFDDTPKTVFSHADELLEIGLDVPSGCHFAHELRKRGMDIPMEVMDVKDLIEAVRQVKAHE